MITGSTDLGNGKLCLTVDHDPSSTATDAYAGSLIIDSSGNVWRKLDDGATTNVILVESSQDRKEPTGFVDRDASTISFTDGTLTFAITPVSGSFTYYIKGKKYTVSSTQSKAIDDIEGLHFIYFDGATLTETTTLSESLFYDYALVGIVYWDAANNKGILVCDERHGVIMDNYTHRYLHFSTGAKWAYGLALYDFVIGDGSLNSHAQFGYESGVIYDEDIKFAFNTDPSPTQIPVFYKTGANGYWRKDTATNFPVKSFVGGSGRLAYNQYTGGAWQQTEVAQGKYVLAFIIACNSTSEPIIAIQGTYEYNTVVLAKLGAYSEITEIALNLPGPEMVILGAVIYETSTTFANTVKARIRVTDQGDNYIDFRGVARINVVPPSSSNIFLGINWSFAQQGSDYLYATDTSFVVVANFVFHGKQVWTPSRLALILSRSSATGTSTIRVWDFTNSLLIATYTWSSATKTLHEVSFSPANLPMGEAIFEIQAKRDAAGDGQPRIHYVLLT